MPTGGSLLPRSASATAGFQRRHLRGHAWAIDTGAWAVEAAFSAAGTDAINRSGPLERHLRDMSVLKQQGFISASRFETVAQVLLGLPPDLGLVGL